MASSTASAAATVSYLSPPPVSAERPIPRDRLLFRGSRAGSIPLRLNSALRRGISPAPIAAKAVAAENADPLNVMIAGAPASGKGTQCELIKAKYGLVHISAGDLLRAEIATGTENGKQAKEFMEKGQLVPDEIVVNMVKGRLLQADAQEKGWLLDGYPRSYSQAMALETLGIRPDIFILLDVPDELLVERVVGRRLDPVTGKIYHLKYSPPENEEIASRLTQRFDDTEEKLQKDDQAAKDLIENGPTRKKVRLPPSEGSGPSKKRKTGKQQGIAESFDLETKQQADALIARMYFTGGVPFNLARNPYYRESYRFIASNNMGGYVPPGYNALRTTLLDKEKKHTARMLEPIKTTWPLKGVTICTDGWSDPQRRPILNFMAVTEGGPMFLKSIATEGQTKSTEYIFDRLKEVIEEVGSENVVQVITDNAANCRAAGLMVEAKYNNIYWTPCIVHTLNLAVKDICDPKNFAGDNEVLWFIRELADEASFIKNYIMNHGMRLSMFNEFSKLKFLQIAETRFASIVIMLKRFLDIRESLVQMVVHANWAAYREVEPTKAQRVKELILNDVWWDKLTYIVSFMLPIYSMIRVADTDKPCLHLIYEMWDDMIEKVKIPIYRHEGKGPNEDCALYIVVKKILLSRWTKSNTPLHCLAHSCNPRYYTPSWVEEVEGRVTPNDDKEILEMRNKCLRKFFPNQDDYKTIKKEFADFALMSNDFLNADSIEDREDFEPKQWWGTHGGSTKLLKKIALKLLGQPASSSCCERNWSTYAFIHSSARNKLTPARAADLVFTHNNHRLISRHSCEYESGPSRMWDVGGDGVESFTGVGMLEGAELSLDEPELEEQMIDDLS